MYTVQIAKHIAETLFESAASVTPLAGECDFNFHIKKADGSEFLLKISHADEDQLNIDMQNSALAWLQRNPSSFLFPILQPALKLNWNDKLNPVPASHIRIFSFLPGKLFAHAATQTPALLQDLGRQLAQLTIALQGFQHPAAKRYLKWDLQQAAWVQEQLQVITNDQDRQCIAYFLQSFFSDTLPLLPTLRHSVIHGDINDYNIVISENNTVTGFIDFGDVVETVTICELAIATAYIILNKQDPLNAAVHVIKAYHAVFPLQEKEITVLYNLICLRLCMSVVNSAIQTRDNPHNAYLAVSEKPAWAALKKLRYLDTQYATDVFRRACQPPMEKNNLLKERQHFIAKNVALSYQQPLHIIRGEGQYLFDETGRRYLDCVNNVAHVGHCHPKVVAAGQQQMAILNTNTRYLHENIIEYAKRLTATLPKPLEVCFFVCSGSEANELALRLAYAHTHKKNILVMDHAYHGNTSALIDISPYKFNGPGGKGKPDFVKVLPLTTSEQTAKILLDQTFMKNTAAFICETLLSCGGQVVLPDHYLQQVYAAVRQAGGVCIADEVQIGLGRLGTHFWGFETQQVIPDIVTMGKPLGNGHPMAAVVTTKEIADSFSNGMEYFNTFGGNPVSCAIGLAVLDVLEENNLQAQALATGHYLKQELHILKSKHALINDVRGLGLFLGIELGCDGKETSQIVNRMKDKGILLSADGPAKNVIKIKPPLVFTQENCDFFIQQLAKVLAYD